MAHTLLMERFVSRTVRRKNYIRHLRGKGKAFSKTSWYIVVERKYHWNSDLNWSVVVYSREPTKEEIYKQNREWFGESRDSAHRSPARWHRKKFENELRTYNNALIRRALNEPDYEAPGAFGSTPQSCNWYWD